MGCVMKKTKESFLFPYTETIIFTENAIDSLNKIYDRYLKDDNLKICFIYRASFKNYK